MEGLLNVINVSVSIRRSAQDVYRFVSNGENLPQSPGVSDQKFGKDAGWVEKDLRTLKTVLES